MKVIKNIDIYSIMPYKIKGKCIYNKETGKKLGCTDGDVQRYLRALYANVPDAKKNEIRTKLKEIFRRSFANIINETAELNKKNVKFRDELNKNQGLDFKPYEVAKIAEVTGPVNNKNAGSGMELSFDKEFNENTIKFVVKKLTNEEDDTKNSFKYGVWYTEYQNEEDFDKPSAEIRYKLSDPIPNDTQEGEIKNKLYSFIKDAIKINN